jgi:predicted transcriptional regulator
MSVMSIRIDDTKRKTLKDIASIEGKSVGGVISELIEDYLEKNKEKIKGLSEKEYLNEIMKMSEKSFMEWDNEEDEIYNEL